MSKCINNNTKTCYSKKSLILIATAYNNVHTSSKINTSQTKDNLWKELKEKIEDCSEEECWLKYIFKYRLTNEEVENIRKDTFKPKGKLPLSTIDIYNVLSQYQKKYNFNFSIDEIKYKYPSFIILNENNHWVVLFLKSKREVYYFDSLGKDISDRIKNIFPQIKYTKTKVQYDNDSCGLYVIEYIISKISKRPLNKSVKLESYYTA